MLTPIKDLDYKILFQLDDRSIVNYCKTDKKANAICKDERFWEQLVINKFLYIDQNILNKYRGDRAWSDYYINDLRKVNVTTQHILEMYLFQGSQTGRLDHVMIAIHNGVDLNYYLRSPLNISPLMVAIENHNLEIVKYLVENGINIKNTYGSYNLIGAILYKEYEILKYLVEIGVDEILDLSEVEYYLNQDDPIDFKRSKDELERDKNKIIEYLKENFGYDPILHRDPRYYR